MNKLLFLLPSLAWVASIFSTALVLKILTRAEVMDNPNERSNHKAPVPRGGGIAMIAVSLLCYAYMGLPPSLLGGALLLMAVSFVDDMRGLPARVRFAAQFVAVAIALPALQSRVLPELPPGIEWVLLAFIWLWFINLTNFMDGIDGISALQAIMMMTGIILFHTFAVPLPIWLPVAAGVLAAGALGFLRFNLSPAKLFMGDVGSIPLGFLGGFLLLSLAAYGHVAAALILPAYYFTDATLTLIKRGLRGEKVWQAHSEHAYQKAVRSGMSHNAVVLRITLLNSVLVGLALVSSHSMMAGIFTVAVAYAAALTLVHRLSHAPAKA